jgi:hypothetical protein
MRALRRTKSWRAEQLREFALHLDETLESLKDVSPQDRRELQQQTGMRFALSMQRASKLCRAVLRLEKRLRLGK